MGNSASRRSLKWRLSWLLAVTTITAVALYGLLAYRAVRTAAIEAAHARLRSVIVQINTITELGSLNQLETLRALAADAAVIDAFSHPARPLSPAAMAALRRLQGTGATPVVVELVGRDGKATHAIPDLSHVPRLELPFVPSPQGETGPLSELDGVMYFQAGISIPAVGGAIRVTRRVGASSANRRIAANLLGQDAALLIGNLDGKLWSDAGPLQYPGSPGTATRYERDGAAWLSSSANVKSTPWLYAVEIPEHVALAPVTALVTPLVLIGALISLAGAFIGLRASGRITSPLATLTAATEAIARGDRNVTLDASDREDEIGRLSRAFGTMATSVRAVQDRLEAEVQTRTGELTNAVDRLRRLDEELRQSERFASLGRVSGNVSHELRNPLGVMSTVVFMLDELPEASPSLKHYAKLLREQIHLSERIINDLLDRARSGAPMYSTVDVTVLLDELIDRASVPPEVQVERRFATPLPPLLLDKVQVGQIVWNLLTNAVQSMQSAPGPQQTLTVGAALVDGRLRVDVCDSGLGVPAEAAERIFEAMYTTKAQGVGLGLSISRSLARANGGELSLSAARTRGACFVLDLPATLAPAVAT